MRTRHCPNCGTPFVRVIAPERSVDRVLAWFSLAPFRCQLCTHQFRAASLDEGQGEVELDRRQFTRLATSMEAQVFGGSQVSGTKRISDISMGGCALSDVNLPKGSFLELVLKPTSEVEDIHIKSAMVCSVRPDSVGVQFLELRPDAKHRLSQVVLGLLVGQNLI
ncbi:MAG TPA: PilZ domain-containing protein [Nitrospira sp.]|nr:PilZ domain-containing protein [Nitrospira sp.]